jgi:ATP adenylyltransferase
MENLWAPWQIESIEGKWEEGCIFCKVSAASSLLKESLILHVGGRAFVILKRFPYHSCHLMVIPLRHTSELTELTLEEKGEVAAGGHRETEGSS